MIKELIKAIYNKNIYKNFEYTPKAFNLIRFTTKDGKYRIFLQFNNKKGLIYSFYIEKLKTFKDKKGQEFNAYVVLKCLYKKNAIPNLKYIKNNLKFLENYYN